MRTAVLAGAAAVAAAGVAVGAAAIPMRGGAASDRPAALVADDFSGRDRLITDEHAYRDRGVPRSPTWTVTSGSLFVHDGHGWTGVPDGGSRDKRTPDATGSAVFRVITKRRDVGDARVAFRVQVRGLSTSSRTPEERSFDGVHVMLRYASPQRLYAASVDRRDGAVLIRKKIPGGPDPANGGTWMDVGTRAVNAIPVGRWQRVVVDVRNAAGGAVAFGVAIDGRTVVTARDDGVGGLPAYTSPGRMGFRCDNADVLLDGLRVTPLVNEPLPSGDRPVSVP